MIRVSPSIIHTFFLRVSTAGGFLADFVALAEAQYSLIIMPHDESDRLIEVSIPEHAVVDFSGNSNYPSLPLKIYYDASYPNAVITKLSASNSELVVAVEFDEEIFGFDPSDLIVSNATIVDFAADSTSRFLIHLLPSSAVSLISIRLGIHGRLNIALVKIH